MRIQELEEVNKSLQDTDVLEMESGVKSFKLPFLKLVDYVKRKLNLARIAFTGRFEDIEGMPDLPTRGYIDLQDQKTLSDAKHYTDVKDQEVKNIISANQSQLSVVAFSGQYIDLEGKPNLANYATSESVSNLADEVSQKVDKQLGKSLTSNDFSDAAKNKLDGVQSGATRNQTDSFLLDRANHVGVLPREALPTATKTLKGGVIAGNYVDVDGNGKISVDISEVVDAVKGEWEIPTKTSQLENDSGFISEEIDPTVPSWAKEPQKPTYTKEEVGLGNVDNTSDIDKPISTAVQTALDGKVSIETGKGLSEEDFTSALKDKLEGIAPEATKNSTDEQLRDRATHTGVQPISSVTGLETALNSKVDKEEGKGLSDTNFTQSEKDKLAGLESSHYKGLYTSEGDLNTALPTASAGDYADVDGGVGEDVQRYIWDTDDEKWVMSGSSASPLTASQVKTLYESNPDTNAFTNDEKSKLQGIEVGAQVNVPTNISASRTGAQVTINNDNGTNAVIGAATENLAGVMTSTDYARFLTIQTGATANATNSQLRDRSTHTGFQSIGTITGLQTALDNKADTAQVNSLTAISSDSGNTLERRGNGLFVPASGGGGDVSGKLDIAKTYVFGEEEEEETIGYTFDWATDQEASDESPGLLLKQLPTAEDPGWSAKGLLTPELIRFDSGGDDGNAYAYFSTTHSPFFQQIRQNYVDDQSAGLALHFDGLATNSRHSAPKPYFGIGCRITNNSTNESNYVPLRYLNTNQSTAPVEFTDDNDIPNKKYVDDNFLKNSDSYSSSIVDYEENSHVGINLDSKEGLSLGFNFEYSDILHPENSGSEIGNVTLGSEEVLGYRESNGPEINPWTLSHEWSVGREGVSITRAYSDGIPDGEEESREVYLTPYEINLRRVEVGELDRDVISFYYDNSSTSLEMNSLHTDREETTTYSQKFVSLNSSGLTTEVVLEDETRELVRLSAESLSLERRPTPSSLETLDIRSEGLKTETTSGVFKVEIFSSTDDTHLPLTYSGPVRLWNDRDIPDVAYVDAQSIFLASVFQSIAALDENTATAADIILAVRTAMS